MRISHVVETLHRGGLERVVIDLVREQQREGHDCQVICLHERGQLADELDRAGIPVHDCDKRDGIDLRAVWRLRRFLRQHDSDVVHTHNVVCNYHAALALVGWRGPQLVNTRHGMGPRKRVGRQQRWYRGSLRRTAWVTTVCESARQHCLAENMVPADKLVSVPNGIPVERFEPASESTRAQLRQQLGLAVGRPIVGSVGRLNWAKEPLGLIRAFAALCTKLDGIEPALVLVGEGKLRGSIESLVAELGLGDKVLLLGDRDDVPALLSGFDLFVLGSKTEGYSIALLEACASALPIVATRVGGNGEIVADGVTGWLVPSGDPAALADAMAAALADPEASRKKGRAGRAWVLEQGSLAAMARHYEDLYRKCR